ncbi:LacI family DNA-binding transcriptional regulator [Propylenella binzhouense]|uniref:LacI family transcriptional regulator n=1 Tax=Propylenella binzhouense TaxID=2555902 RepID=A0A964WVJ1_9HYPH|nr:LacI family DNA-binding transcriptional regulator [Propylenella binzhouense]MYZ50104.1 LacI family transcriptional regulator [Propylenella binzhouense]
MRKRVTLKDVAQAVGVHVSTVSRALDPKTRHLITPEIADRILKASERLDYRPNAAAYSLKTKRTRTIGVIVPDITNPIFPPIIRGVEDALADQGYFAILANTDGKAGREAAIADTLLWRGVDGLVLASVERHDRLVERLLAEAIPIVTVNRRVEREDIASVVHDDRDGMRRVLAHLADLGHTRIANIAGPQSFSTGRERYEAFESVRAALGLDPDRRLVVFASGFNEDEGERCTAELLDGGVPFTAIVCSNDRLAIGAIAALRQRGLACPDDVSVTGYNDMPMLDRLFPPLTTIRIEQYQAGAMAAELLVEMIEEAPEHRKPRHIVLPVELVVRGSTAPPSPARNAARPKGRGRKAAVSENPAAG